MTTLPQDLKRLADRTESEKDARLLWRAAIQLEVLYQSMGMPDENACPTGQLPTLEAARLNGEKRLLLNVIFQTNGNKAAAARRLRISRVAVYKTLKKHGLLKP